MGDLVRHFVRRLRYAVRDAIASAFPARTTRKRMASAVAEMQCRAAGARDPAWRGPLDPPASAADYSVQMVAFHTDSAWAAVQRAVPQFTRHVQPHLSGELGFSEPSPANVRRQVDLARRHGIVAFCFRAAMEGDSLQMPAPLEILLASPDMDLRFCLFLDGDLSASPALPLRLLDVLVDPRALRVDGRPLLGVMHPSGGHGVPEAWREAMRAGQGRDLFLVQPFDGRPGLAAGVEAAVQMPPLGVPPVGTPRRIEPIHRDFAGTVDEHLHLATAAIAQAKAAGVPLFPGAAPGFDDTPLRGPAARILVSADPVDAFARWLSEAAFLADARPVAGARLVFVNAWNDWARGAHLEPDARLGHGPLRAVSSVLAPYALAPAAVQEGTAPAPVPARSPAAGTSATVVHAFYPELLARLLAGLDLGQPLYVTTPPDREDEVRRILAAQAPRAQVRVFENRGRDVRPFLGLLPELQAEGFDVVLKLHTKRSPHHGGKGADWLAQLSGPLARLQRDGGIGAAFQAHPTLGMLGAAGHVLDGAAFAGVAGNTAWVRRLCRDLDLSGLAQPCPPANYGYVAGTMFAARLSALAPLVRRPDLDRFEPDMGLTDGTLAHGFERFFGVLVAAAGLTVGTVAEQGGGTLVLAPQARPLTGNYVFAPQAG